MPVLATIAAVSFLFGGSDSSVSFFDSDSIRANLKANFDPDDPKKLSVAIQVVDKLEFALNRYNSAANAAVDLAIQRSAGGIESANQSYSQLTRLDQDRAKAIESVIEYRSQLASLLGPEDWDAVIGL